MTAHPLAQSKRPIAIAYVVFGGLGAIAGIQRALTFQFIELQKRLLRDFAALFRQYDLPPPDLSAFQEWFRAPKLFLDWSVVTGVLQLFLSLAFLYAAARLLKGAPNGVKLFARLLALSIATRVLFVIGNFAFGSGAFGAATSLGDAVSVFIDAAFLLVLTRSKAPQEPAPT